VADVTRGLVLVSGELGLEKSIVVLRPHDPGWIDLGRRECAIVRRLLRGIAIDVVHVGSTSVPGLEAKPILDIVAAVEDVAQIDDVIACLSEEYTYDGDKREDGGLLFLRSIGPLRTVHLHVVGSTSRAWRMYLRFHDLLLADAAARERYQATKRSLASQFPHDRLSYTNGKASVIAELLAKRKDGPPAR
jgi:GrpB-like predicted nucleotidyltransferase (UPF0157 family)